MFNNVVMSGAECVSADIFYVNAFSCLELKTQKQVKDTIHLTFSAW